MTALADRARGGVEADAVVPHRDRHYAVVGVDADGDRLRPGVADGVVQRLLDDAVELHLHGRGELERAVDLQVGFQAVGAAEDIEVLPHGGDEAVGLEARRAQLEDQRPQLGLRLARELPHAVDLRLGAPRVGSHETGRRLGRQRQAEEVPRRAAHARAGCVPRSR